MLSIRSEGGNPDRRPTVGQRVVVSIAIATISAMVTYLEPTRAGGIPSDFSQPWFGAVSILSGANPYRLIGQGGFSRTVIPSFIRLRRPS